MALFPNTTTVPASSSAASITASDVTAAVQDLQTSASPQFAGIHLGHASDTTLTRSAAGQLAVEGVDVVTLSATQTLTNKTLTAPRLASGGFIADANGNEGLILVTTASAVNEVTLTNAATGGNPKLEATGGDTNIGLDVQTKGTGVVRLLGNATQPAEVRLFEDTDNGTNYVGIKSPASVASNLTFQLPSATGAGKVLTDVNGDGVLTMETVSATDNTKLPTDGSGSMTGPMIHSANGTATSSNYEIVRITNKYVRNVPSGKAISDRVNGVEMLGLDGNGDTFSIGRVDDGYSYVVGNYGNNYYNCPYGGTHLFRVNGAVIGHFPLTPSDMPYSQAGTTFTNDGNWYNLYSLAQGTHNGEIKIACALFGGLVTFTINGTSISLINDGWGGSYADTTAASGKIAFRVSGGYLQINVGTGISSTPRKFLAIFNGTVN